ncbi:unnamed protein product, partial [marine sediment metagenome]
GATKYGELWDENQFSLLIKSTDEAMADAGVKRNEIEAVWMGIYYYFTGLSGGTFADALKLWGIPITRVENYCASGMDAFRNACNAVASGVNDVVLACGVEKILDEGSRGLPGFRKFGHPMYPRPSAPAIF